METIIWKKVGRGKCQRCYKVKIIGGIPCGGLCKKCFYESRENVKRMDEAVKKAGISIF